MIFVAASLFPLNSARLNLILINVDFATAYFLMGELWLLSTSFRKPSDGA
jgi:hypothetical protein